MTVIHGKKKETTKKKQITANRDEKSTKYRAFRKEIERSRERRKEENNYEKKGMN